MVLIDRILVSVLQNHSLAWLRYRRDVLMPGKLPYSRVPIRAPSKVAWTSLRGARQSPIRYTSPGISAKPTACFEKTLQNGGCGRPPSVP